MNGRGKCQGLAVISDCQEFAGSPGGRFRVLIPTTFQIHQQFSSSDLSVHVRVHGLYKLGYFIKY